MSFFEGRPFEPTPEPERPPTPEWLGPPEATAGGYLPERLILLRSDDVVLMLDGFRCFPTGVMFDQQLWVRDIDIEEPPWGRPFRPNQTEGPALRFGVMFSDGSSWSNLDVRRMGNPFEAPTGPVVWHRGGGSDGRHWCSESWLWPLPPAGPVQFLAAWPDRGLAESAVEIEGGTFREAAGQAESMWNEPPTALRHPSA